MQWLNLIGASTSGLAAAVAAHLLITRGHPRREPGWRYVGAGAMIWFGVYLGSSLSAALLYTRLFIGSALPDPEHQMFILTWLIVGFGGATLFCGFVAHAILAPQVRWQPGWLEYTARSGERFHRGFDEVVLIDRRALHGDFVIRFVGGGTINLLELASWVHELIDAIILSQPSAEDDEFEIEE